MNGVRLVIGMSAALSTLHGGAAPAQSLKKATDATATRSIFALSQTDAVLRGIEVGAEAEAVSHIFVEGSYSAMKTENTATGESLPLMPPDNLRGSIRYAPVRFGAIRAPFVRLGERHVWGKRIAGPTEPFADADVNPAFYGIGSTPAYTLYEAGLGGRLLVGANPIDLSVDAQNLFNTAYRDFLDTQKGFALSMGRNVSVRISIPFALSR